MEPILIDVGADRWDLGDLVPKRDGVFALLGDLVPKRDGVFARAACYSVS